jgi:hypothetical protein
MLGWIIAEINKKISFFYLAAVIEIRQFSSVKGFQISVGEQ